MEKIKLPHGEWLYDPDKPLGEPGGFGAVFEGTAEGYENLAIKKLHLSANEAEHRELDMADDLINRELSHIIPILDAGLDANSENYFIVMKRADKSLADEIEQQGTLDDITAVHILLEIVEGLVEVSDIVHRDLKPANVLSHEGKWKISDFGIARFIEETTSTNTLKGCLSPEYAAPEQWKLERATQFTDVYALGCIGYALIKGRPPFDGPETSDFRDQHLNSSPLALDNCIPRLAILLTGMLRKVPNSRPNLSRVKEVLKSISESPMNSNTLASAEALARAGARIAQQEAEQEARAANWAQSLKYRDDLGKEAYRILNSIKEELILQITTTVPNIVREYDNTLELGGAILSISYPHGEFTFPEGQFPKCGWDLIGMATIEVRQDNPEYVWSASLYYADRGAGEYRWWEVPFMSTPWGPKHNFEPFALSLSKDADEAISPNVTGQYQRARTPRPIDGEDLDDFCERWMEIFAKAANGRLQHPSSLPFRD